MAIINREPLQQSKIFIGQNKPKCFVTNIANGSAAICTSRSPDKSTINEDASALIPVDKQSSVLVIADGAGGMRCGEKASELAITTLIDAIERSIKDKTELRESILNGIEQANKDILALGIGAATTISVVEQVGINVRTYHVGDSEIIVMGQRGRLIHQTIPHSPIGYALEAGLIDADEALHHDERHFVSNLLGTTDMHIAIGPMIKLAKYDTVLLSSDGLTDNFSSDTIINTIRKGRLSASARKLFKQTLEHMQSSKDEVISKPDDITIISYRPYPIK